MAAAPCLALSSHIVPRKPDGLPAPKASQEREPSIPMPMTFCGFMPAFSVARTPPSTPSSLQEKNIHFSASGLAVGVVDTTSIELTMVLSYGIETMCDLICG